MLCLGRSYINDVYEFFYSLLRNNEPWIYCLQATESANM